MTDHGHHEAPPAAEPPAPDSAWETAQVQQQVQQQIDTHQRLQLSYNTFEESTEDSQDTKPTTPIQRIAALLVLALWFTFMIWLIQKGSQPGGPFYLG